MKDEFWGLSDGWHGPVRHRSTETIIEGFHDYIDGWHGDGHIEGYRETFRDI